MSKLILQVVLLQPNRDIMTRGVWTIQLAFLHMSLAMVLDNKQKVIVSMNSVRFTVWRSYLITRVV